MQTWVSDPDRGELDGRGHQAQGCQYSMVNRAGDAEGWALLDRGSLPVQGRDRLEQEQVCQVETIGSSCPQVSCCPLLSGPFLPLLSECWDFSSGPVTHRSQLYPRGG